ncbi:MAG: hypothetical protein LBR80_02565 [Deltaproteobacteria bacterium]|jgi:hypothetical protein|nr:hypothetical protein [Deltaproteobacteria bacterium]
MADDIETVKREVMRYAELVYDIMDVNRVFLCGPAAQDSFDLMHDVEIAFFFDDFPQEKSFDINMKLIRISNEFDALIHPLAFPTSEIARRNPIVCNILETGKEIFYT